MHTDTPCQLSLHRDACESFNIWFFSVGPLSWVTESDSWWKLPLTCILQRLSKRTSYNEKSHKMNETFFESTLMDGMGDSIGCEQTDKRIKKNSSNCVECGRADSRHRKLVMGISIQCTANSTEEDELMKHEWTRVREWATLHIVCMLLRFHFDERLNKSTQNNIRPMKRTQLYVCTF